MSNTGTNPENDKKEPLFIPRDNGMGWNLNFNNPKSYWVLAAILTFPFIITALAIHLKK